MLISIDGREHPELLSKGQTLEELLKAVKERVGSSGRMIVAIECDGEVLGPDQLDDALAGRTDAYRQIDFQSAVPAELARQALGATTSMLDEIRPLTGSVADQLNQSRIADAMKTMERLFGLWNDVYRGVYNTLKLLNIDPASIELSTGTAADQMGRLLEHLRGVKETLQNKDYVQLADIFSYELEPSIQEWKTMTDSLMEQVSEDHSQA